MAGEFEPEDSRNVTGANQQSAPNAAGEPSGGARWNGDGQNASQDAGQQQQFDSSGSGQMGGGAPSRWAEQVRDHMEVIGADGVHLGTVDRLDGERIKLTRADSGMGGHSGHHHYIPCALIAGVEGDKIRLSANADVAYGMEEEE
jgi:hypothetical protein